MLLTSAAVPLPLRKTITVELGSTYTNGIFVVGSYTSKRDSMIDLLPLLTRTPALCAVGSSKILLPRVFPLVSHGDVPAKYILLVTESNCITTETQLALWSVVSASGTHFSHLLSEIFGSPTFALRVKVIQTDSTLFEANTADFLPKKHDIQVDCYASLLVAKCIGINIIKFCISKLN